MKYLVAVSGGIDSVVLLDMLVRADENELIVAHFDHGIRDDSADDARFVAKLARKYKLPFVTKREELGAQASEDMARTRRYKFLHSQAQANGAAIVTAHHQDDLIESIAINLTRGTGWRGLAVLDGAGIGRPLLGLTKVDVRTYARVNRLEWVEDSTNASDKYLRNRLRRRIATGLSYEQKQALVELRHQQLQVKSKVDQELLKYTKEDGEYSRYLLIMADQTVAAELLRSMVIAGAGWSPTRPQTVRALLAVKVARAGSVFEIGAGVNLCFTTQTFIVKTP